MENLKYSLVQTSQIVSELQCLFENSPKLCLKQNASGWGTNQRIILVKDKKLIYGKVYQTFRQGQTVDIPEKQVKSFVNLEDIYEVNYLPTDKLQKKTLNILIPQNRLNQKSLSNFPNNNSKTNLNQNLKPSQKGLKDDQEQQPRKLVKWVFHFPYDLKQRLSQLRNMKKQEQRKKNQLKSNIDEGIVGILGNGNTQMGKSNKNNGNFLLGEVSQSLSNAMTPRSPRHEQQQIPLEQYVNQIRKAKQFLKFKENKEKMQKNQRRKNKQKQNTYQQVSTFNNQQEKHPISTHWRDYFRSLQQLIELKNPQKTTYQYQLIVYKEIHHFKQTCINIFKSYIFEKINGINAEKWQFEKFYYYKGIWIKLGGKELNHQFLMYYYLSDLTHIFNKTSKIHYRIPNICLVQYLGFKGLCMCDLPFSQIIERSQVYNMNTQVYDMHSISKIKQNLAFFQKALNLKNQQISKQRKRIPAPLGSNLRIFEYHPKKDMKSDQSSLQIFYYIVNLQSLFPLDFNYQLTEFQPLCRLRPQLASDVREILQMDYQQNTQLLSTAFMQSNMNQETKTREDDKVVKASKYILKQKIPQLIHKLNNCQLILIDSYSIKMYLSQFGINIRYLYKIHEMSTIKYIRQIIEVQCLARTAKKLFFKSIKEMMETELREKEKENIMKKNIFDGLLDQQNQQNQLNNQLNQQKFKQDQVKFRQNALDFLNLIFGKGQQNQLFWKILIKQTENYFKILVAYPFQGSPGSLLHAVLYNCGIEAVFNIEIPLFKVSQPFSKQNQLTLRAKVKGLQNPSFQIQKLIKSMPNIQTLNTNQIQLFQDIALKLFKMDLLKNYYLYENDFHFHLSFSKISLIKQDMQKPTHANSHHPSQISYYISNKSEINFQKGLNLLNFAFSDFHPVYISFYQQYSEVYQPQLLKKTSILQSIKCFGQFHPKTTQLYSYIYSQGYKQFYNKSLRTKQITSSNINMRGQYQRKMFYSCMEYSLKQLNMSKQQESRIQKANCYEYLDMLFMGMRAATKIRYLQNSLIISEAISDLLNKFKIREYMLHYELIQQILKVKMILTQQKMFLYKMSLLCLTIRQRYDQSSLKRDKFGFLLPAEGQLKQNLAKGIMNEYFTHQTHSLWLKNIFKHLLASFQYFNHLQDLFNNIEYHIERYDNIFFRQSLGYWDILVRLYGEKMFKDYLYETGNI